MERDERAQNQNDGSRSRERATHAIAQHGAKLSERKKQRKASCPKNDHERRAHKRRGRRGGGCDKKIEPSAGKEDRRGAEGKGELGRPELRCPSEKPLIQPAEDTMRTRGMARFEPRSSEKSEAAEKHDYTKNQGGAMLEACKAAGPIERLTEDSGRSAESRVRNDPPRIVGKMRRNRSRPGCGASTAIQGNKATAHSRTMRAACEAGEKDGEEGHDNQI